MDFKKSLIRAFLLVFLCSTLYGCGKSEAVKNVEALIDGIGEVTVDSEESIKEAEEAYNALTDKEKEQVENADQIAKKREELDACIEKKKEEERKKLEEERKAELAPFVGSWKPLLMSDWMSHRYGKETNVLIIKEDDQIARVYGKDTLVDVPGYSGGDLKLVDDHGITKLVSHHDVFVRVEDYDEVVEKEFVSVGLNDDNIGDYIGGPVEIGKYLNEWGDETDTKAYILSSPAYENDGLIMLAYNDVKYEMYYRGIEDPITYHEPYALGYAVGYGDPVMSHFGRAEGRVWYIREDYVDSISEPSESGEARKITFTDGFSADFYAPSMEYVTASVTDLEF